MREILGRMDTPCSSYILILRESAKEALSYWEEHKKRYPTWGCLVFPDKDAVVFDVFPAPLGEGIHKVFFDTSYIRKTDEEIIQIAKHICPPYSEDDPIVEEPEPYKPPEDDSVTIHRRVSEDPILLGSECSLSRAHIMFGGDKALAEGTEIAKRRLLAKIAASPDFWVIDKVDTPEGGVTISARLAICRPIIPRSPDPRCTIGIDPRADDVDDDTIHRVLDRHFKGYL